MDRDAKIAFLVQQYKKHGINTDGFYPNYDRYECPIRNPNYITIGPSGEIYKCWNDVGNKQRIVGSLLNKTSINKSLLMRYHTAGDPFEDQRCLDCFHLPTCGGGCPYLRIKNEYEGMCIDTCCYIKDNLSEFLELHLDYKRRINAKLQATT